MPLEPLVYPMESRQGYTKGLGACSGTWIASSSWGDAAAVLDTAALLAFNKSPIGLEDENARLKAEIAALKGETPEDEPDSQPVTVEFGPH